MKNFVVAFFLTISFFSFSQEKDFAKLMHDPAVTFQQKQQAFNEFFKGKDTKEKGKGWKQFKRWEYMQRDRVDANGFTPDPMVIYTEWKKAHAQFENNNSQNRSGNNNSVQTTSSWQYIGPPNGISTGTGVGRLCFITFDPTTPTTIFVGSPGGGLWKSTNSGTNWTVVNDQLANLGAAHLAIDPTNSNVMYLSTGDRDATDNYSVGLLKSSDGGLTWNTTGLSYVVSALQHVNCVLIDPTNTQVLYAATGQGVFKSIDAGANWISVKPGNYQDLKFKPTDANTVYACGSGGFAHSANAGVTWTNGSFPTPTGSLGRVAMAVTAADPTIVYVLAGQGAAQNYGFAGFYKSTNSAASFTKVCSSPNLLGWNTTGSDVGGQAWYDLIVAANPTNANEVICGGVNTWRSTNGGTTFGLFTYWLGGTKPYVHADCHAIEYSPTASTNIFIGCDGGLFSTTNSGTSFAMSSTGLQIGQQYRLGVSQTSSNLTLTGWQDNGCSLTNQGTNSTNLVLGGDGMEVAIDPTTSSVMFGEQYNGKIYKSSNGGTNFGNIVGTGGTAGTVDEDGDWVTPYVIDPSNHNTLYVGKTEIYQSTDDGATFNALTASGGGLFVCLAVAPSNGNYVYGSKGGSLWYTSDGINFTQTTAPGSITYLSVDPLNPVRIWCTVGGYAAGSKVFYSNDSGVSWTNISMNLPNLPANCIVYQPGSADGLYVGTDIGVYYKDNNLPGWVFYSNGLPNVIVKEMEFQISTMKLRAATYGRGLWQIDPYSTPTAAPVSAFSSNKTNVCVGGNVNFYDNSSNLPYAWNWTFTGGNPATSNQQSPTAITYSAAGTYPVKLVSTNGAGSDSTTVNTYITVLAGPTILHKADTSICRGDTIQLFASGGTQYSWSPNNWLSNVNISNPKSWAYNTKTYTVTVIGSNGCTSNGTVKVSVVPVPSNPVVYTNTDSLCCSPATGVHYQWYLNGNALTGDTMHCLHITQNGSYYCQITDTSTCQYKLNSPVNNYNSVGVKSFANQEGIEIYPNPAQVSGGTVNIKFGNSKKYDVKVYSVKGDLVYEQQIQADANTAYPLKLTLQSGMYFIHVGDESKKQVYTIQKLTIIE